MIMVCSYVTFPAKGGSRRDAEPSCYPYSRFVSLARSCSSVCPGRACSSGDQRVEQDPHGLLERRPHGLLRTGVFVLGHGLRRDDEQVVGRRGNSACGCAVTMKTLAPARLATPASASTVER